ncbi:MAG TPA: hypothetical protein DDY98_07605 [Ruminococcaceae bacterium]|nr:hypothetical protein [Oscillospiraceae bacterium]
MKIEFVSIGIMAVLCVIVVIFDAVKLFGNSETNDLLKKVESAQEVAESIIARVALFLLTDAERTYGAGTGELKMSACLTELLKLLPEWVSEIVPKAWLAEKLETALEIAKAKWNSNPNLLK